MSIILPLFVAIPLLAAAFAVVFPQQWLRDALHILVPIMGGATGLVLYYYTSTHGVIAHNIGHYPGGVAIAFAADPFSAIMLVTTSIVAVTATWFASVSGETRARFFPALTLTLLAGGYGALLTADLFNFFVMIEVMLLPSYGLMTMTGTPFRLAGGRVFIIVNLSASTVLLTGAAIVYGVVGTVNLAALRGVAAGHGPATVAMALVIIAIAVKAGVFPVHTWLPRTYPSTSAAVMGLFSGLHTKVAGYFLYRLYVLVFDLDERWHTLIIVFMTLSMLIGGFAGLAEHSIRQVLAYQMINGMPFILVMLAFSTPDPARALAAGLFYVLHHMITIGGLILASGAIEKTYGTDTLSRLSDLSLREPWIATLFAAGAFSIVGLPPFSGFWAKVMVVLSVARPGTNWSWLVIAVIILASFGALLAMLRIWQMVFWGRSMDRFPASLRIRPALAAPATVLISLSLVMFFGGGVLHDMVLRATQQLLDVDAYQYAVLGPQPAAAIGLPHLSPTPGSH